jgi:hypothetical protein
MRFLALARQPWPAIPDHLNPAFHAVARQPVIPDLPLASPIRRATGRLRLRVSTPVFPPQVAQPASAPQRPHCRMRVSTPDCMQYPDFDGLTISTPPRVGFPNFQPKLLFPDSFPSSPIVYADNSPESHREMPTCDAAVQTETAQSSPQPLSLQQLQGELQCLRHELHSSLQTEPNAIAQSSSQPLSLQQLQTELQVFRNELRVLVMAFGF